MEVYRTTGDSDDETQRAAESGFALPPIVPIPSGTELEALGDQPKFEINR